MAAPAGLGCASSAAQGTGCAAGAIGGAVSAATANEIATAVTGGQGVTDPAQLAAITAATMLLGGTAAGLLGQNASAAALAAENETLNNTCAAGHNCGTLASALADTGHAAWNTALGIVQSVPNAVNGALPGYPDYVPFLQDAMLPYDDPDFGSLVSLVGTVGAASLVGSGSSATNSADYSAIGSTGQVGEQYLQSLGGQSQVYFSTSLGGRYVDQLIDGVANESKVGYTSFTTSVQTQVAKDVELMNSGAVNGVNWNFFTSPVTGLGGPSQPLLKALQSSGIGE